MLLPPLKSGEYLTIGDGIAVQIFRSGSSFRVSVRAPREVPIVRGEIREREGAVRPGGLRAAGPRVRLTGQGMPAAPGRMPWCRFMEDTKDIPARMGGLTGPRGRRARFSSPAKEVEALQARLKLVERATS